MPEDFPEEGGAQAPPTAEQIEGAVYRRMSYLYGTQCASCHGDRGMGNGPLANLYYPMPSFEDPGYWITFDQERAQRVILKGSAPERIRSRMPPFLGQLDEADVDQMIDYLRSFERELEEGK